MAGWAAYQVGRGGYGGGYGAGDYGNGYAAGFPWPTSWPWEGGDAGTGTGSFCPMQYQADDDSIDLSDSNTWPKPPVDGPVKEGTPSRKKPASRGEKSLYDEKSGEWRPHVKDKYHPKTHWDYKAPGEKSKWQNIPM